MSIETAPFYFAVCDCCGERCPYGDNYAAWSTEENAREYTEDGFQSVDGLDLCSACWCWPEDLPDYPGDEAWTGTDDAVRRHSDHLPITPRKEQS